MGDVGAAALGAALRQNRSITTLSYDRNSIELEGFKAVRGCLYGNKKLVLVSPPVEDYEVGEGFRYVCLLRIDSFGTQNDG